MTASLFFSFTLAQPHFIYSPDSAANFANHTDCPSSCPRDSQDTSNMKREQVHFEQISISRNNVAGRQMVEGKRKKKKQRRSVLHHSNTLTLQHRQSSPLNASPLMLDSHIHKEIPEGPRERSNCKRLISDRGNMEGIERWRQKPKGKLLKVLYKSEDGKKDSSFQLRHRKTHSNTPTHPASLTE